ncbi:muscle M-line assembly protein unc-89-like isoform X2 [Ananas comosus]|uniref:Muscle M-line assembly protein unc-89-like isoform X2 n=1 Tax=Ananas comosus TaxID=4615 RepID=A0A6P5EUV4_ANACO|nr:muscle M-line assembly protein unc-89-like isoform X2 [Ananas comosus]
MEDPYPSASKERRAAAEEELRRLVSEDSGATPTMLRVAWRHSAERADPCGAVRSPDQLDNGADDGVDVAITLLEPIEERFPLLADPDILYQDKCELIEEDCLADSAKGPVKCSIEDNFSELETFHAQEDQTLDKTSKQIQRVPQLSVSPERKKPKSSKFNLRKSLAWDSAFFTSEGVLNTEELAIVNSTFRKAETLALPEIPEETRISSESILDIDNWALENPNLEVELFENVRASIQKSLGKSDNASNTTSCSLKKDQRGLDASRLASREKVDRSSQNKIKLPVAVKQHGLSKQQPQNISKKTHAVLKLVTHGTLDPDESLKPSRILPKATRVMVPSKTSASGNSQTKSSVINRQPVNKTANDSRKVTPKSTVPPKYSSGVVSRNAVLSTAASTTQSTILTSSSDSITRFPSENTKKKTTASRNTAHPSSGTANKKTPSKKTPLRTSSTKLELKSPGIKIPSVSPSSSIDSAASVSALSVSSAMTSVSALSVSSAIKSSDRTESLDFGSSSPPSFLENNGLSSLGLQSTIDLPAIRGISEPAPKDVSIHGISEPAPKDVSIHGISEPAPKDVFPSSTNASSQGRRSFKPTGLRMPRPKIGYFEAEKSLVRNIDTVAPASQPPSFVKNTSGVSRSIEVDTVKPNKIQYSRSDTQKSTAALDNGHIQSLHQMVENRTKSSPNEKEGCIGKERMIAFPTKKENVPSDKSDDLIRAIQCEDLNNKAMAVELVREKVSSLSLLETKDL